MQGATPRRTSAAPPGTSSDLPVGHRDALPARLACRRSTEDERSRLRAGLGLDLERCVVAPADSNAAGHSHDRGATERPALFAGSGIVHSERTPPEERRGGAPLHGIQTWVALPLKDEQAQPSFTHIPRSRLPALSDKGVEIRVIAGSAFGQRAPTPVFSETLYAAVELAAGAKLALPPEHEERAIHVVSGEIAVDGVTIAPFHVAALAAGGTVEITAASAARLMLFGGARIDEDRHIWWNFVASSRELMEEAKQRWREQRFPPVPDETEFIPLPEDAGK